MAVHRQLDILNQPWHRSALIETALLMYKEDSWPGDHGSRVFVSVARIPLEAPYRKQHH